MKKLRGLAGAVLVVGILMAVPAVAMPLDQDGGGGWWSELLEVVSRWFGQDMSETVGVAVAADDGGGATTNSGGCFDPNGRPRPCS